MNENLKRALAVALCVLLLITALMMDAVVGKVKPVFQMLSGSSGTTQTPDEITTKPNETEETTDPTEEPPVTTEPSGSTEPPITTEPGHVHDFKLSKTIAASCYSDGFSVYMCSCNATEIRDRVTSPGHKFGTGEVIEPTCEIGGYTKYTCKSCKYIEKRNYTTKLGHNYETIGTTNATCTVDGKVTTKCTNCQDVHVEVTEKATGHSYGDWVPSAEEGKEEQTCGACGDVQYRDVEPVGPGGETTVPTGPSGETTVPTEPPEETTVPTEPPEETTVPTEPSEETTVPTEPPEETTVPTETPEESTGSEENSDTIEE